MVYNFQDSIEKIYNHWKCIINGYFVNNITHATPLFITFAFERFNSYCRQLMAMLLCRNLNYSIFEWVYPNGNLPRHCSLG